MLPEVPQHFGRTANLAHFLPKGFVQLLTTATRVHPHRDRQRRNFLSAVVQAGDGGFELAQPFQQHLILLALRIEFPPLFLNLLLHSLYWCRLRIALRLLSLHFV
jgi:hypothetical protein